MTDYGRGNLVFFLGTDWTRTWTYYNPAAILRLVTATAASGAVSISIANGSAASVTFTAGDLISLGSAANLYEIDTGATIAAAGTGTITIKGAGLAQQAASAVVTQYTPINLTGCEVRLQVRATPSSTVKILDLTSNPAAGFTMGGAAGTITGVVTNAQLTEGPTGLDLSSITAQPAWVIEELDDGTKLKGYGKVGVFDLELVDSLGKVSRLYQGQCVFDAEVTRG